MLPKKPPTSELKPSFYSIFQGSGWEVLPGLGWLVQLRWYAGLGLVTAMIVAWWGFDVAMNGSRGIILVTTLLVLLITNGFASFGDVQHRLNRPHGIALVLSVDIMLLTLILAVTGGPTNPFSVLYVVHVTLAAILLGTGWTWTLATLSVLGFGVLFLISPAHPAEHQNHGQGPGFSLHLQGMWLAFGVASAVIAYWVSRVVTLLRHQHAALQDSQTRALRNERLVSLATLAAGAAHELGSPLATIAVAAKELEHLATSVPQAVTLLEDAKLIRHEVARCKTILAGLSGASGQTPGEAAAWVNIQGIRQATEQLMAQPWIDRVEWIDALGETKVLVPLHGLALTLTTLIKNGVQASAHSEKIQVFLSSKQKVFLIMVQDHGTGMAPQVLQHAMDPFFTTRPPGEGMGLGLFLAHGFANSLGGSLHLASQPQYGTSVTMELPCSIG